MKKQEREENAKLKKLFFIICRKAKDFYEIRNERGFTLVQPDNQDAALLYITLSSVREVDGDNVELIELLENYNPKTHIILASVENQYVRYTPVDISRILKKWK